MRSMCLRVDNRWAMATMVLDLSSMRIFKLSWISFSVWLSSEEVASSKIKMGASLRMARAIAILCLWPPDSLMPRSRS